jgi:exodeoxyribonuclease VIII
MQQNTITKISDEEYFAISTHVNASTLKELYRKSPKHYQAGLDNPEEPHRALTLGSAIHSLVLEGSDHFIENYVVIPEFEPTEIDKKTNKVKPKTSGWKNTKDYKEQKAQFLKSNYKKTILDQDEYDLCHAVNKAVIESPYYFAIESGECEVTVLAKARGIDAKAKFDIIFEMGDEVFIMDLKTTKDASEEGFMKSVFNYDYDLAAAWYKEVLLSIPGYENKHIRFQWLAVEKQAPFSVCCYEASDEVMMNGRAKCSKALVKYKEWLAVGGESGYKAEEEVVPIKVPSWGRA